jgi:hypothetical protein
LASLHAQRVIWRSGMLPCWQLMNCGREAGGAKADELGVCPAYPNHGHSCWIIAGTYCNADVQGTFAKKAQACVLCEVYKEYSTSFGTRREQVKQHHPEEVEHCLVFLSKKRP